MDEALGPVSPPGVERTLIAHSALAGLTPLIPLPFVDDVARGYVQRRMVRSLAEAHALVLWEEEVSVLGDARSGSMVQGMLRGIALAPIKLVLRKAVVVLTGKRVVDVASACYHQGWMVERSFARGWCAPQGPHSARVVRSAVDAVLEEVPVATSPVTSALRVGFERSRDGLGSAVTALRERLGGARADDVDRAVAEAVDPGNEASGLGAVVSEMRRALDAVPREHFEALERRLAERLADPGRD